MVEDTTPARPRDAAPTRDPDAPTAPPPPEPLWRDVLGERLRTVRRERGETLTDVAGRAGVSPQYLSEIERGRKEPSSEMIAAVGGALDLTLLELTGVVVEQLSARRAQQRAGSRRSTYALAA